MNSESTLQPNTENTHSKLKVILFILEIALILVLLFIWLFSKSVQNSKNLIVLFFYSFPSEFLVGLVPHEPVLLYFGKFFSPLTVALVSVIGTVLAEAINYTVFGFVADTKIFEKISKKNSVKQIVNLFKKAPFTAIIVAGFTPVPFFPVRFLVVMGHYPIMKYLFGVFVSRAPRFFILAQIGYYFNIPGTLLIILFVTLILSTHFSVFGSLFKKNKENSSVTDTEY